MTTPKPKQKKYNPSYYLAHYKKIALSIFPAYQMSFVALIP